MSVPLIIINISFVAAFERISALKFPKFCLLATPAVAFFVTLLLVLGILRRDVIRIIKNLHTISSQ